MLDEELLAAAERGARLLLPKRDPRNRLQGHDGRPSRAGAAALRGCARPSSLIWVVMTPRFVSIAPGEHCLLGTAFPALDPDLRSGFPQVARVRSAIAPRPAGRVPSVTTRRQRSPIVTTSLVDLRGGRNPRCLPAPVHSRHDAGGRPVACSESLKPLATAATRVRA